MRRCEDKLGRDSPSSGRWKSDLARLANALLLGVQMTFWGVARKRGRLGDLERAAGCAREAGDRTLEAEILQHAHSSRHGTVAGRGDGGARGDASRVPGRTRLAALATRADIAAMRDDHGAARMFLADADRLARELQGLGTRADRSGDRSSGGDAAEAERWLLVELETLAEIGDWGATT